MVQLSLSEIQTIQLRPERPKSEHLYTEHEFVRISDVYCKLPFVGSKKSPNVHDVIYGSPLRLLGYSGDDCHIA